MALTNKLSAIGDAIRAKTGGTELLTLDEMPVAISGIQTGGGGGGIPEKALVISDECANRFANNGWNWFIEEYSNQITTENIGGNDDQMFINSTALIRIPFELNFADGHTFHSTSSMFAGCYNLINIPKFNNFSPINMSSMFQQCMKITTLPDITMRRDYWDNPDSPWNCGQSQMFYECRSLRSIPECWLIPPAQIYDTGSVFYWGFYGCEQLDELVNVPLCTGYTDWQSNAFENAFDWCSRLKELTFKTYDQTFDWHNQYINLETVGTMMGGNNSFEYGIQMDKLVETAEDYARLKDDPDWYTNKAEFSRYNHTSAVNTINSLPTVTGENNILNFGGGCSFRGEGTDGGAIGNLTADEIAVAAAKGWTVALS